MSGGSYAEFGGIAGYVEAVPAFPAADRDQQPPEEAFVETKPRPADFHRLAFAAHQLLPRRDRLRSHRKWVLRMTTEAKERNATSGAAQLVSSI